MDIHGINIYAIGIKPTSVTTLAGIGTPGSKKKGGYAWADLMDADGILLQDSDGEQLQSYERI